MIYLLLPPGDATALQEFLSKFSPLRSTTYTRTDGFCCKQTLDSLSRRETKSTCSAATGNGVFCKTTPISCTSGRKRYNTLDFPQENRVPTGRFHPYWKPQSKETCSPFTIPAHLCICTNKPKNRFVITDPKRKNAPDFIRRKDEIRGICVADFMNRGIDS